MDLSTEYEVVAKYEGRDYRGIHAPTYRLSLESKVTENITQFEIYVTEREFRTISIGEIFTFSVNVTSIPMHAI